MVSDQWSPETFCQNHTESFWMTERENKEFWRKTLTDKTIVANYGAELKIKPIYTSFGVGFITYNRNWLEIILES